MAYVSTQQAILSALRADQGSYSYQVVSRTMLEKKLVSRKLGRMVKEGIIDRATDGNGAFLYFLKSESPPTFHATKKVRTLDAQSTAALWHRVSMLKRMRERTMDDYHPLLDAVIKDYVTYLRSEEEYE